MSSQMAREKAERHAQLAETARAVGSVVTTANVDMQDGDVGTSQLKKRTATKPQDAFVASDAKLESRVPLLDHIDSLTPVGFLAGVDEVECLTIRRDPSRAGEFFVAVSGFNRAEDEGKTRNVVRVFSSAKKSSNERSKLKSSVKLVGEFSLDAKVDELHILPQSGCKVMCLCNRRLRCFDMLQDGQEMWKSPLAEFDQVLEVDDALLAFDSLKGALHTIKIGLNDELRIKQEPGMLPVGAVLEVDSRGSHIAAATLQYRPLDNKGLSHLQFFSRSVDGKLEKTATLERRNGVCHVRFVASASSQVARFVILDEHSGEVEFFELSRNGGLKATHVVKLVTAGFACPRKFVITSFPTGSVWVVRAKGGEVHMRQLIQDTTTTVWKLRHLKVASKGMTPASEDSWETLEDWVTQVEIDRSLTALVSCDGRQRVLLWC